MSLAKISEKKMSLDLKINKYTLLYVEDNETTRLFTSMFLKPFFKHIIEAKNGKEALVLYAKEKPDIIITDIEMPVLNGLDFCKEIRKIDLQIPIMITTAHTSVEYLLEAVEINLVKFLSKPLDEEKVLEGLKLCFERIELNTPSVILLDENFHYDILNHVLVKEKSIISLSASEVLLLDILIKNSKRVVSYQELENYIWPDGYMTKDSLRSLVRKVRQLIGKERIENISKIGYKIKLHG